jgi:hypothetical protein
MIALKHGLSLGLMTVLIAGCAQGNPSAEQPSSAIAPSSTQSTSAQASPTNTANATPLKSGSFQSGEQPTQGTVRIVQTNGGSILELDQSFQTSNQGPDLVVILHRSKDVLGSTQPPAYPIKEGDYVILAPLQAFSGAQQYPIPNTINLAEYQSAGIWCRKFNATFGAAVLN